MLDDACASAPVDVPGPCPATGDPLRDKSVILLLKGLGGNPSMSDPRLFDKAVLAERVIFQQNNSTTGDAYRADVRSHFLNLKENIKLQTKVVEGQISPEEFAKLRGEELASPERLEEDERLRREAMLSHLGVDDLKPVHIENDRDQYVRADKLIWSGGDTDRRPNS